MEVNQKLKYRLIEATTEDPDYPLYELMRGADSSGWTSVRFCTYPQEILIQFLTPVTLKQINILSNEKRIPSMIEFYSYYPSSVSDIFTNYKQVTFDKLGYIRMDTNSKTNYKAREYRKVYINSNCVFLKLVLHKNYVNKYNVFNQVGVISVEFFGTPIHINKNELYLKETIRNIEFKEEELDEISQEKIKIMRTQQEEAIQKENFDEAKKLKQTIDKIKLIGKRIYELDKQKKMYINNEDFDNAKILKFEIDRLKSNLKYVDKNLSIVPYQNASFDINKSSDGEENKDNFIMDETSNKVDRSFAREMRERDMKETYFIIFY
jgi:centrosomal protein CEP104